MCESSAVAAQVPNCRNRSCRYLRSTRKSLCCDNHRAEPPSGQPMDHISDPFRQNRKETGLFEAEFQGEQVPMILRHEDVRRAAKDWKTFSSDAPFRVPIPSEEDVRSMRQLPIETNPL